MSVTLVNHPNWITKCEGLAANAAQRGLTFNLCPLQVEALYTTTDRCAYTQVKFDMSCPRNKPTVERIDHTIGYELANLCLVTREANVLKDVFFDKNRTDRINYEKVQLINKIALSLEKIKNGELPSLEYIARYNVINTGYDLGDEIEMTTYLDHSGVTSRLFNILKSVAGANLFRITAQMVYNLVRLNTCNITGATCDSESTFLQPTLELINPNDGYIDSNIMLICVTAQVVRASGLTRDQVTKLV